MSERTALLIMDVQKLIVERLAGPDYLDRVEEAVDHARSGGTQVIHVTVGFRPGAPEIHPRNKMFAGLAGRRAAPAGVDPNPIHPRVEPRPEDVVVVKRRVSAFAGSDLDMVLRAGGFDHLVLAGIATSGVVLSTVRQAADLDYRLTVLSDACADGDPEVHRVLTEKVFPRQAEVVTVAEWAKG
ncbi:cysteine hydrolase family protein [Streptomyces sp. NPDC060184]|uniref:cysteine hydrolase family protein n=1 Tax=Streptomyces sp. NPDC060184 TaxID=3347064 RepID=UPI003654666E